MNQIGYYWKAVVGFIAPGLVLLGSAVTDASQGGSRITQSEWITAIIACFVTSAGVYTVRNRNRGVPPVDGA